MGLLEGPMRAIAFGFQKALAVRSVRALFMMTRYSGNHVIVPAAFSCDDHVRLIQISLEKFLPLIFLQTSTNPASCPCRFLS